MASHLAVYSLRSWCAHSRLAVWKTKPPPCPGVRPTPSVSRPIPKGQGEKRKVNHHGPVWVEGAPQEYKSTIPMGSHAGAMDSGGE